LVGTPLVFGFYRTNQVLLYLGGAICLFGFFFLIMGLLVILLNLTNTKISLKYKKEQPNFFSRNRDEIIIGIVMLILGVVIGKFL